jgi:uncharacterized protein (TIGR02145 family)
MSRFKGSFIVGLAAALVGLILMGCVEYLESGQSGSSGQSGQSRLYSATEYFLRGGMHSNNGNYDLAIEDYTEAIRLNPNFAGAYNERAWIYAYHLKRDFDRAIADANQAIKISPNEATFYDTRGWAYLGKGDYNSANDDFVKALKLNPDLEESKEGLKKVREVLADTTPSVSAQTSNGPKTDGESWWQKVETRDKWGDVSGYHYTTTSGNNMMSVIYLYYPEQKIIVALFFKPDYNYNNNVSISLRDKNKNTYTFAGIRDDVHAKQTANPGMFASVTFRDPNLKKTLEAHEVFEFVIESGQGVITSGTIKGGLPPEQQAGGTFTDARDGKTYRTVKIGEQTWMAENLNYQTGNSWCYADTDSNCIQYGRLYDWGTATKACPVGWHLPTIGEWVKLTNVAGGSRNAGTKLKSKSPKWDGTDALGFSALPGGSKFDTDQYIPIESQGEGSWWTATEADEYGPTQAYDQNMVTGSTWVTRSEYDGVKNNGLSVRCVQD